MTNALGVDIHVIFVLRPLSTLLRLMCVDTATIGVFGLICKNICYLEDVCPKI